MKIIILEIIMNYLDKNFILEDSKMSIKIMKLKIKELEIII
jgi:hypothetical protein